MDGWGMIIGANIIVVVFLFIGAVPKWYLCIRGQGGWDLPVFQNRGWVVAFFHILKVKSVPVLGRKTIFTIHIV